MTGIMEGIIKDSFFVCLQEVLPGFIICSHDTLCSTGRIFEAQVVVLEHKSIICPGYTAVLHIHNAVEEVTLMALVATIDRKTGEKSKTRPRYVKQDQVCIARFKTSNLICMETFAKFQPMGRFTLRDEGGLINNQIQYQILLCLLGMIRLPAPPPPVSVTHRFNVGFKAPLKQAKILPLLNIH